MPEALLARQSIASSQRRPKARSIAPELLAFLMEQGYSDMRLVPGLGVCGLHRYLYTCGIVVGLTAVSYSGRYCYASVQEAMGSFAAWDGQGDPPGAWIKYKGATERLGPGASDNDRRFWDAGA